MHSWILCPIWHLQNLKNEWRSTLKGNSLHVFQNIGKYKKRVADSAKYTKTNYLAGFSCYIF